MSFGSATSFQLDDGARHGTGAPHKHRRRGPARRRENDGFFLQQDVEIDLGGRVHVKSRELIGYDPETQAFSSYVYSNLSPLPLPYKWDLQDGTLTISVSYGP